MQESTDIFCTLTSWGEMQEVSPSWQNFTGQKENEYRGRGWLEAFHPADQPQIEEMLIQTVASGGSSEYLNCSSSLMTCIQKKQPLFEATEDKNSMHHKRVARKQVRHFVLVLCFNDHQ